MFMNFLISVAAALALGLVLAPMMYWLIER